jgi:hypothetical protein
MQPSTRRNAMRFDLFREKLREWRDNRCDPEHYALAQQLLEFTDEQLDAAFWCHARVVDPNPESEPGGVAVRALLTIVLAEDCVTGDGSSALSLVIELLTFDTIHAMMD